jgi:hypothetical protein
VVNNTEPTKKAATTTALNSRYSLLTFFVAVPATIIIALAAEPVIAGVWQFMTALPKGFIAVIVFAGLAAIALELVSETLEGQQRTRLRIAAVAGLVIEVAVFVYAVAFHYPTVESTSSAMPAAVQSPLSSNEWPLIPDTKTFAASLRNIGPHNLNLICTDDDCEKLADQIRTLAIKEAGWSNTSIIGDRNPTISSDSIEVLAPERDKGAAMDLRNALTSAYESFLAGQRILFLPNQQCPCLTISIGRKPHPWQP